MSNPVSPPFPSLVTGDLRAVLSRGLVGLAGATTGDETEGRRRRRVAATLGPLRARLRACPDEALLLVRWLCDGGWALRDEPAAWAEMLPDIPRPDVAHLAAVADVALGLPPLVGDDALLRECEARQPGRGAQRIIGHPSPYPAIWALAARFSPGLGEYLCDLGAGHGRVVLALAHLGLPARGIELLPDRWASGEAARRAHRLAGARFDCGDVLDDRFWSGPDSVAAAGWFYCYDPFDDSTQAALMERLRVIAAGRPTRLVAFVQTSRYRDRYAAHIVAGHLRREWPAEARLDLGVHIFRVAP